MEQFIEAENQEIDIEEAKNILGKITLE